MLQKQKQIALNVEPKNKHLASPQNSARHNWVCKRNCLLVPSLSKWQEPLSPSNCRKCVLFKKNWGFFWLYFRCVCNCVFACRELRSWLYVLGSYFFSSGSKPLQLCFGVTFATYIYKMCRLLLTATAGELRVSGVQWFCNMTNGLFFDILLSNDPVVYWSNGPRIQ